MRLSLLPLLTMQRNLRASRDALDRQRRQRLRRQIESAYHNVPYYWRLFNSMNLKPTDIRDVDDLGNLPVVTKQDIRRDPGAFLNRRLHRESLHRSHTSGSTGEPTWTYYDRISWYRKKYLSKLRARRACGLSWGERIAVFDAVATRTLRESNRILALGGLIFKIRYFSVFDDVDAALPHLIRMNPENAYGPPSYLFLLARALQKHNLRLHKLKRIFTSSEYLEKPIRQYMAAVFQADIYDVYGSTEMKEIAWECGHGLGYHINQDEIVCEIVDAAGQPLYSHRAGNIVVSDLHNQAMPLIRFWVGDKGLKVDANCSCGCTFELMQPLAGRASDYIILPDGTRLSPYLFTTAIEKTRGLLQYQIVQNTASDLSLFVIFDAPHYEDGRQALKQTLQRLTGGTMTIAVHRRSKIDVEANGKFKVVKSLLAPSALKEIEDGSSP